MIRDLFQAQNLKEEQEIFGIYQNVEIFLLPEE